VQVKLESPLGVSERFLENYKQAASLGGKITEDDKVELKEITDSIEAYEKSVLDALQLKLDKLDAILNQVQPKKKKSASRWRRRRRRLNPNQTLNPKP
jgi:cytochrome c peroxidase